MHIGGISGRVAASLKLEARGLVTCRQGMYAVADCPGAFGRELARLAAGG